MPKIVDPKTRLSEEWEPSPPPPSPVGGNYPPPPRLVPIIHPPSLCEQGPCANYHEIVALMDSATPMDGTLRAHTQTLRTCYPHPGIEMPLNGSPVFSCNRYRPSAHPTMSRLDAIEVFQATPEWKKYQDDLAQWHALFPKPEPAPDAQPPTPASALDLDALGLPSVKGPAHE